MRRYTKIIPQRRPTAVALGCFDGLHTGHMQVLENALRGRRRGLSPLVFTFASGDGRLKGGQALMTQFRKEALLERMGFDACCTAAFDSLRHLEPEAFVRDVLLQALQAKEVFCGFNYRFGRGGAGDAAALCRLCGKYGVQVQVSPPVTQGGAPVSSTRIRQAIAGGDMLLAKALLGRPFSVDFPVAKGNRLGRLLGAPTINQPFPHSFVLPRFGVYGSCVCWEGRRYWGVTNVGVKPTVGAGAPLAETWIAGFDGDLYGKRVTVELLAFLREERRFESLDALKRQIQLDAKNAYELVKKQGNQGFNLYK